MEREIIEMTQEEHEQNVCDYIDALLEFRSEYRKKVCIHDYAMNALVFIFLDLLDFGLSTETISKIVSESCNIAKRKLKRGEE